MTPAWWSLPRYGARARVYLRMVTSTRAATHLVDLLPLRRVDSDPESCGFAAWDLYGAHCLGRASVAQLEAETGRPHGYLVRLVCHGCDGMTHHPGNAMRTCPTCNGKGALPAPPLPADTTWLP